MNQSSTLQQIDKGIFIFSRLLSLLIFLGFSALCVLVFLGATENPLSYLYLLLLVPAIAAGVYLSTRLRKMRILKRIKESWGKPDLTKTRDFSSIKLLNDAAVEEEDSPIQVDDQTWNDLNMDDIYTQIDRTLTDPGEAVLYRMLRQPLLDKNALDNRSNVIKAFRENMEVREKVRYNLAVLGHQQMTNDVFLLLWGEMLQARIFQRLLTLLASAALLSIAVPFIWWSVILTVVPVSIFIINLIIHYVARRRFSDQIYSFPYLLSCIKTAGRLATIESDELKPCTSQLGAIYKSAKKILKKTRFLFPAKDASSGNPMEIFLEYLNIFFLLEVRSFYAATAEINRQIETLRELYLLIGELDALQSVASYRESLPAFAEPEFIPGDNSLKVTEASYPLLENPVPASVNFTERGVIITGSNMAGKSTFLRNIGCNVLLAQTITTCCAKRYRAGFFRVMSSISRTDDVIAGKSFYYVEAERILRTIKSLDSEVATLCIIDELLSGTNSVERLRASEAIITYLIRQNSLVICATHDMELIDRLNGSCDLYHFEGTADETGLKFDHQIKPGPATTHNAIELLEYLGYPKEITDTAKE